MSITAAFRYLLYSIIRYNYKVTESAEFCRVIAIEGFNFFSCDVLLDSIDQEIIHTSNVKSLK